MPEEHSGDEGVIQSPEDGPRCEIYIPAPEDSMREEAFTWHIATRNFFAFIFLKPLVGVHLGKSIVQLQERLHTFRSSKEVNNHSDLMEYLEEMGYLEFGHNPDYALAILYYAEHYRLQDLWIDAFAHCVGMNDLLSMSSEFEVSPPISHLSVVPLLTAAYSQSLV